MTDITDIRDYSSLWRRPGYLIRRLHQIHIAIFLEECREFNLTPVQFGVLTVLYDQGTLDQVTIASQLGIDRNTAADVIRRLERRNLLERPPSVVDKRTKLARINKLGRELVEAVKPYMIRTQERLTDILTDEEHSVLMDIMEKVVVSNNATSRAPWRQTDKPSQYKLK